MSKKQIAITVLSTLGLMLMMVSTAFAQDAELAKEMAQIDASKWKAIAGALAISIAAFGGALGQGRAAAAALEGIARNPGASGRIFTPMILGLALIESLVIYALVIAFVVAL